jgi:hypothetical protein
MRFHKIVLILSVLGLFFGSSALAATYELAPLHLTPLSPTNTIP